MNRDFLKTLVIAFAVLLLMMSMTVACNKKSSSAGPSVPTSTPTITPTYTATPVPAPGDANDPNIQLYGRWDMTDVQSPRTGWGTAYIITKFDGTSIGIKLSDTYQSGEYFEYSIDGGTFVKFQITGASQTLASGLADTTHTFTWVRRTEGAVGITTFKGFVLDSGKTLQPPDARPLRKMEFIGDSITCGYGTEGSGGVNADENGYVSYASQLARLFNAEWRTISKSGIGVYRNFGESTPVTGTHMIDFFPRTLFGYTNPQWDFTVWTPDVVVIALGTNDFSGGYVPDQNAFKAAYSNLISFVRSKYPNAYIFCTEPIPSWVGTTASTYMSEVVTAKNTAGDGRVYWMAVNTPTALLSGGDYIGDYTHPTPAGHTIIANYMYTKMHATLNPLNGW